MIEQTNRGGRVVHLFIPFKFNDEDVTKIVLRAVEFGDAQDWEDGKFRSSLELLAKLAGKTEGCIRKVKYPDAQRLMEEFIRHLPYPMDQAVREGTVPLPRVPHDVPVNERGLAPDDPPIPGPHDFPGDPNQGLMPTEENTIGFEGLEPNG